MAYATVADVEGRLGRDLTPEEEEQILILLEDAEAILKTRIPDLDQQITDGKIPLRIVVMVEVNMIIRVLRNPEAFISETDGNYSYQRSADSASGYLGVLPIEWDWLLGGRGMFQLVPIPPYGEVNEGFTRQSNAHIWCPPSYGWVVHVP